MEWISVKNKLPLCLESGDWDGKRSDYLILSNGKAISVGRLYYGKLDGSIFADFVTDTDFILEGVTHWMPLPEPPKTY